MFLGGLEGPFQAHSPCSEPTNVGKNFFFNLKINLKKFKKNLKDKFIFKKYLNI